MDISSQCNSIFSYSFTFLLKEMNATHYKLLCYLKRNLNQTREVCVLSGGSFGKMDGSVS